MVNLKLSRLLKRNKVLIVDDDPENLISTKEILDAFDLEGIPFHVASSDDIAKVEEFWKEHEEIGICLIDLKMPCPPNWSCSEDATGNELCRRLHEIRTTSVLFAYTSHTLPARRTEIPFNRCFSKVLSPTELHSEAMDEISKAIAENPEAWEPAEDCTAEFSPEEMRQDSDVEFGLNNPETQRLFGGRVVAIFNKKVWGSGWTHTEALQDALTWMSRHPDPGNPMRDDFVYVPVPGQITEASTYPKY
jgi:CheY-like chemotaxis protein